MLPLNPHLQKCLRDLFSWKCTGLFQTKNSGKEVADSFIIRKMYTSHLTGMKTSLYMNQGRHLLGCLSILPSFLLLW